MATFRDKLLALGFEVARASPDGFGFQATKPGVEPGHAPRLGQARVDPLLGNLLLQGLGALDPFGRPERIGLGQLEGGSLGPVGFAA
jgi:hypothetical protein